MSRRGPSSMASTAARHWPGAKGVFIRGMSVRPAVWAAGWGVAAGASRGAAALCLARR